ncbi:MAG TPA: hypothetical protein VI670_10780 [Thermoanaerobaculia bacterium]
MLQHASPPTVIDDRRLPTAVPAKPLDPVLLADEIVRALAAG